MSREQDSLPEWQRTLFWQTQPEPEKDEVRADPLVQLSPTFIEQLRQDGKSVDDVLSSIRGLTPGQAIKRLNQLTGYPKRVVRRALRDEEEALDIPPPLKEVIHWFKGKRRRHWILGNNERRFAQDLLSLSEGKPTDVVMWNCLEFQWEQEPSFGYPPCRISSNLDTSILLYHRERLREVAQRFTAIGRIGLIALVPSSEATYERMWTYRQPREERQVIVDQTVKSLSDQLAKLPLPSNTTIQAERWDDFLKRRGIMKEPETYSREGEQRILNSSDIDQVRIEVTENGAEYFRGFGIKVDPQKVADRRIRYYGMYEGEGAAIADIRKSGTNVIVINFEEFRVARLALRGAKGQLPIVTPLSDEEMNTYYRWERLAKKQQGEK